MHRPLFLFGEGWDAALASHFFHEEKLCSLKTVPAKLGGFGASATRAPFSSELYKWMFPKIGVGPQNGWFTMENPMNKWMIWGYHYFWKHPNHHRTPTFNKPRISISWHKNSGKEKHVLHVFHLTAKGPGAWNEVGKLSCKNGHASKQLQKLGRQRDCKNLGHIQYWQIHFCGSNYLSHSHMLKILVILIHRRP